MESEYEDTISDITRVDPIKFIREYPERFVSFTELNTFTLAIRVSFDFFGSPYRICLFQQGNWWALASNEDWVELYRGELSIEQYFSRMLPFPEFADNAMHSEVLCTAFASRLVTMTPETMTVLLGDAPEEDFQSITEQKLPNWKRLIAFQVSAPFPLGDSVQ